jgi:LPS-assembly protein
MMRRNRFLITAIFLCHQLLACGLVTSRLLAQATDQNAKSTQNPEKAPQAITLSPTLESVCGKRAATRLTDGTIICAVTQEKIGEIYQLHVDAEIHYQDYILKADEATYNTDTGEATGTGHVTLDGGPNDDHIKASHGTYNLTTEIGRFYDVTGTTGFHLQGTRMILKSTSPFAFQGKMVEKTSPDHYVVNDGSITTCQLPHPDWEFRAHNINVEVGANATMHNSSFFLLGVPVFFFPYATYPTDREARQTGFLMPVLSKSSTNGYMVGDAFYWDINRSLDATVGAELLSSRGWSQRGEFRARPSDTSYIDLSYYGVVDRGTPIAITPTLSVNLKEGGEDTHLGAEENFAGFRAVSNIDYLSSFLFRLAFNESFTAAINSEVKSQVFMARADDGYFLSGVVERYQNFFQLANDGVLTNPPVFDAIQIWHAPSIDAASAEREIGHSPFVWSFDGSISGLSRSEPGFHTPSLLGRFDFSPEISAPLHFAGWSIRPGLALHETYYTERFESDVSTPGPGCSTSASPSPTFTCALHNPTNRQALDASVEVRPPALEKVFGTEFLGRKWKHVIEPRVVYRFVDGVNDSASVLHFDERDILSDTNEVEYGVVMRLYAKRTNPQPAESCENEMAGIVIGGAAPEQGMPWRKPDPLKELCPKGPDVRELFTWQLAQKYFLDPNFGGALVPGQRNVFTSTEDLTGIAFLTEPRHLSPLVSRLRAETSSRTDTEWDLDYDFQLGRINSSTLLVNYNFGQFQVGGGDAFLQIPQTQNNTSIPSEGTCAAAPTTEQVTCKFQQFRVALGYGGNTRRGFSAASSFGFDAEINKLQFATIQSTYNWDCCGMTLEYRRYEIANVRNENLFRFSFTLAKIGSFGNLRKQERLY